MGIDIKENVSFGKETIDLRRYICDSCGDHGYTEPNKDKPSNWIAFTIRITSNGKMPSIETIYCCSKKCVKFYFTQSCFNDVSDAIIDANEE